MHRNPKKTVNLGKPIAMNVSIRYSSLIVLSLCLALSSCGLFKKKCDCPDLRRSKRIATHPSEKHDSTHASSENLYLRDAV
jgi:hypothetical protein